MTLDEYRHWQGKVKPDILNEAYLISHDNPEWSTRKCLGYARFNLLDKAPRFQTSNPDWVMDNYRLEVDPEETPEISSFIGLEELTTKAILDYDKRVGGLIPHTLKNTIN